MIENVGVAAYLGAANKITNPAYITAAGSILTVEARHQAWLNSAVIKENPWQGPEDTPLGFSDVYSIAAAFITSCPSTNPTLPVKAFPAATVVETTYKAGDTVTLKFPTTGTPEARKPCPRPPLSHHSHLLTWVLPFTVVIYSGLTSTVVAIPEDFKVTIPSTIEGTSYAVITTAGSLFFRSLDVMSKILNCRSLCYLGSASDVSDDNTVAGPIIMNFPFTAKQT